MNVHEELFVGGEWRKPESKARVSVVCPSTEEVIGQVPDAGAEDVDVAVRGAVFTTDPERAAQVARRVRTGTFSVNAFIYNTEAPFGGVKNSGIGRDTGPEAVQAYYELKTINLDAPTAAIFS